MTIGETRAFEFDVATLERESQFLGIGDRWVINRHSKQTISRIEHLAEGIELELVQIPGGSFLMGSPQDEQDFFSCVNSESPQHIVTIRPFCLGKYPVTQAQWRAVAALPPVNCDLDPDPSTFKGDSLPVEGVTWYDAAEFCDRLTQLTQRSYRLPTEAEWEYACRAGTTTPFHFGEKLSPELANYKTSAVQTYKADYSYSIGLGRESRGSTTPVGSFGVANAFGLYDMHGNVCEWCLDDGRSYEGAPTDGSARADDTNTNPSRKPYKAVQRNGRWFIYPVDCPSAEQSFYDVWDQAVLRGGSWFCHSAYCRSGYRRLNDTAHRVVCSKDIGFRIALC